MKETTMLISKTQVIGGLPAPKAREVVRLLDTNTGSVATYLGVSKDVAEGLLRALEREGYVELADGRTEWWDVTMKGSALRQARIGRPITRAKADALLDGVIERVKAYNADPKHLLTVESLTVFGSYLDETKPVIGDLDIQFVVSRRPTDQGYPVAAWEYARQSGRTFATPHLRWFYPETELRTILKNRSPYISLTDQELDFTNTTRVVFTAEPSPSTIRRSPRGN
jgi:DNA-binding transcriptional ArsR family regulator